MDYRKRKYIDNRMFGGMGSMDDESQSWHYVRSQLDRDPNWTPPSTFSCGLPSDEDDCIRDAYNNLRDDDY